MQRPQAGGLERPIDVNASNTRTAAGGYFGKFGYRAQMEAFLGAFRRGEAPSPGLDDAIADLRREGYDARTFWERLKKTGPAEILTEVRVPLRPGAGSAYEKVERRAGEVRRTIKKFQPP